MREIKFRAWGIISNRMRSWENVLMDGMLLSAIGLPPDECRLVWLQYTGLKDKNGVEIYEGDIATYRTWQGKVGGKLKTVNAEVYWDKNAWCIKWKTKLGVGSTGLHIPESEEFGSEVIGNIYENPELTSQGQM